MAFGHGNTNSSSDRNWNQEWGTAGTDPIRSLFGDGQWRDFELWAGEAASWTLHVSCAVPRKLGREPWQPCR